MTRKVIIFLLLSLITGCVSVQRPSAGIAQFIETRSGKLSVWGVDVRLDHLRFRPEVRRDQIAILDGKRSLDLRRLMRWTVTPDGKCLQIRFKPGMGDFGTGNGVTIHVQKSAIISQHAIPNRLEWSIGTDRQ